MEERIGIRFAAVLLALMFTSACSKTTQVPSVAPASPVPIRSENVVHADVRRVEIPAGGSAEAVVRLSIDDGYHVNANPPTFPYLKATELVIPPAEALTAGPVTYPAALKKKFEFAEEQLDVYEGQIELKVPMKAQSSAAKGDRTIAATLQVQACDEQVCYPPGVINLQIPISIR